MSGAVGKCGEGTCDKGFEWPANSWQAQYAELHRGILNGSTPAGSRRYLLWTCGMTFQKPGCTLKSRACNCVGYANRMLGMASAFLAAIITSRAFLIAWPGQERVQLYNFFESDLIDWRVTDEVSLISSCPFEASCVVKCICMRRSWQN
jgi:hypothetical protein